VQLAARLCAQAKPDQILAAEDFIRHHAGDRSLFSELGLITPKGFDQPTRSGSPLAGPDDWAPFGFRVSAFCPRRNEVESAGFESTV
jgi:class 3 adenylate cyclase